MKAKAGNPLPPGSQTHAVLQEFPDAEEIATINKIYGGHVGLFRTGIHGARRAP